MTLSAENIVAMAVVGLVGSLTGVVAYFLKRHIRTLDEERKEQQGREKQLVERQERALGALGEKIERLTEKFSDQMQQVRSEVSALRVEVTREVATLRTELGAVKSRQDGLERDLNQAMRWVRTEVAGIQQELASLDGKEGGP